MSAFDKYNYRRRPRACLLCPSVRLSVTPTVRGADEQQKTKFAPTYSVRLQSMLYCVRQLKATIEGGSGSNDQGGSRSMYPTCG